ncbi:alpha/beta hydrolase family protein [Nocardia sp. NPDC058499]|uniref:alpha/beta hydrolase family protein n=1 Tax=Nocardia sp. NPDC058499 TaxID=3346530 RepID=UPI0036561313
MVAAVFVGGCSESSDSDDPATTSSPHAGELLTSLPLASDSTATVPGAASTRVITYRSQNAQGEPIVVSGSVAIPATEPPPEGWPVVSWAHGTTGYADTCAPSVDTRDGLEHDYLGPITQTLASWISAGYAVVQTDYEGLGTPGGHPYINGTSAANTVTDIVRAARALDPSIGKNWVVAGHSQGGHAALFTAQNAPQRAPELNLRGAIAIAPGGTGLKQMVEFVRTDQPGAAAAEAFLPVIVLGAQAVDPSIEPSQVFTARAQPLVTAARTGCLAQIRAIPPIPPGQVFAPDADLATLNTYLDAQDPIRLSPQVPTMIAQGSADTAVAEPSTDTLVKALCDKETRLDYRVYDDADHRASVPASLGDAQEFAAAALSDRVTTETCKR